MKQRMRAVLSAAAIVVVVAAGGALVYEKTRPEPLIPKTISRQLTSVAFLPAADSVVADRTSVKYNTAEKILSYSVSFASKDLTVSEQPTPEQFTDIPQVYDKVVAQMNNYQSFQSRDGTVHLTTPAQLKGGQTAVMNAKGTLLFVKPSANLTTDEWKQFFKDFRAAD